MTWLGSAKLKIVNSATDIDSILLYTETAKRRLLACTLYVKLIA